MHPFNTPAVQDDSYWGDVVNSLLLRPPYRKPHKPKEQVKEKKEMNGVVQATEFHLSGTGTNPLTEERVDMWVGHFQSSELVASVDAVYNLDENRAKLFLVFVRPLSFAELTELG